MNALDPNWLKAFGDGSIEELLDESNTGMGLISSATLDQIVRILAPGGRLKGDVEKERFMEEMNNFSIQNNRNYLSFFEPEIAEINIGSKEHPRMVSKAVKK